MKTKIKNGMIYFAVFLMLIFSFQMPQILFEMEDASCSKMIFKREKASGKLDVQAENIYLVKAIHDMKEGKFMVKITPYKEVEVVEKTSNQAISYVKQGEDTQLKQEMEKMQKLGILKKAEWKEDSPMIQTEKWYRKDEVNYQTNIFAKGEIFAEIESKMGKCMTFSFPKDMLADLEKQEIMQNYIQYLDLYIVDDWQFENGKMVSQKAQLEVILVMNEKYCTLEIGIMNKPRNTVVEYWGGSD